MAFSICLGILHIVAKFLCQRKDQGYMHGRRLKPRRGSLRLTVHLRGRQQLNRPRRWTVGGTPSSCDFNRRCKTACHTQAFAKG
jgi:hypothetical protein